jgi:hypothetical protein
MNQFLRSRRMGVGLTVTAVILLAQVVVGATAAEARCAGVNAPTTSTFGPPASPTPYVIEEPVQGTCNNNGQYTGRIKRATTKVNFVEVWIQNNGQWRSAWMTDSLTGEDYVVSDANSNTYMTLCYYLNGNVRCGWGTNLGPLGVTPQFAPDTFNGLGLHGVNSGF